jgi:hypothetical protein
VSEQNDQNEQAGQDEKTLKAAAKAAQDELQASERAQKQQAKMAKSAMAANDRVLSVKEQLDLQPKVRIRIPAMPNMPADKAKDHFVTVQINGYTYQINRGAWVEVPSEVANILGEAGYI